jgi:hypothetical protein
MTNVGERPFGVSLCNRGHAPIAIGHVDAAEEAVGVGRGTSQQALAIASEAQLVAVLGIQLQLRGGEPIAVEIGNPSAQLAALIQHELAEIDLAADIADVLLEVAQRMRPMQDLERDLQIAEGLALEGESPFAIGHHGLGDATLAVLWAAALTAATEVEPDAGLRDGLAELVDYTAPQNDLDALFASVAGALGISRGALEVTALGKGCAGCLGCFGNLDFVCRGPSADWRLGVDQRLLHEEASRTEQEESTNQEDYRLLLHAGMG